MFIEPVLMLRMCEQVFSTNGDYIGSDYLFWTWSLYHFSDSFLLFKVIIRSVKYVNRQSYMSLYIFGDVLFILQGKSKLK